MKKNIIIVGAGLSGTILSNELVQRANVILLEKGPKRTYKFPKIEYLNKPLGQVKTFCNGKGGTTNLWHNGLIPINIEDINHLNFKAILQSVTKYMNPAAKKLFWVDGEYIKEYNRVVKETKNLIRKIKDFDVDIDCLLYPKKYSPIEPLDKVNTFFNVKGLQFEYSKNKIESVTFKSNEGIHTINADIVIISSGALGTPEIVKKIYDDLNFPSDSIGIGFADHPMGFVGKVKIKNEYNQIFKNLSLSDQGSFVSRTAIRLKSKYGNYTSAAFIRPAITMANELSLYKYKSGLGASRGSKRIQYLFSPKLINPDVLAEIISQLFNVPIPGRVYNIMFINDQKRKTDKVTYANNKIILDWNISDKELSVYNEMLIKLENLLRPISEEIKINTKITANWLWSGAHHSGTISVGSAPDDILDSNLKMKLLDNAYVCDASVIQEHSYANTGLSIGQLALRLSNQLMAK